MEIRRGCPDACLIAAVRVWQALPCYTARAMDKQNHSASYVSLRFDVIVAQAVSAQSEEERKQNGCTRER
eukprot:2086103-Amphidinium_carterae.1